MRRPPASLRRVALPALAALTLATGCGGGGGTSAGTGSGTGQAPATTQAPPPAATTTTPAGSGTSTAPLRSVTVYFADDSGHLVAETHRTPVTSSALRSALVALSDGPAQLGLAPALPAGTTIVGTDVRNGQATVNLSSAFVSGYPTGGAAAELAVVGALVYTATAVPGVERVQITVDGREPAPAGSQLDWSGTFSRADFPGALAR